MTGHPAGTKTGDTGFSHTLSLIGGKYKMIVLYCLGEESGRQSLLVKLTGNTIVSDEALTAGQYVELMTNIRREFSGLSPLLKAEFVKQAIFQRTGILLKRADIEQYEENSVLVRKGRGDTANDYGMKVHINSTQLVFLFQDRAYLLTALSAATSSFAKDTLKEAWKWHGEILVTNSDRP